MGRQVLVYGGYVRPNTLIMGRFGLLARAQAYLLAQFPSFLGRPPIWSPCVPFGARAPVKHAIAEQGRLLLPGPGAGFQGLGLQ